MRKSQHTPAYQRLVRTLRRIREEAGITQEEAASRLEVYSSFISKCESGERRVDAVELALFCQAYRIDLVDFLRQAGLVR